MATKNLKMFIIRNKEVFMFLIGFGIMHFGWYNLQRNKTLNKALTVAGEKETLMVSLKKCILKLHHHLE